MWPWSNISIHTHSVHGQSAMGKWAHWKIWLFHLKIQESSYCLLQIRGMSHFQNGCETSQPSLEVFQTWLPKRRISKLKALGYLILTFNYSSLKTYEYILLIHKRSLQCALYLNLLKLHWNCTAGCAHVPTWTYVLNLYFPELRPV